MPRTHLYLTPYTVRTLPDHCTVKDGGVGGVTRIAPWIHPKTKRKPKGNKRGCNQLGLIKHGEGISSASDADYSDKATIPVRAVPPKPVGKAFIIIGECRTWVGRLHYCSQQE